MDSVEFADVVIEFSLIMHTTMTTMPTYMHLMQLLCYLKISAQCNIFVYFLLTRINYAMQCSTYQPVYYVTVHIGY